MNGAMQSYTGDAGLHEYMRYSAENPTDDAGFGEQRWNSKPARKCQSRKEDDHRMDAVDPSTGHLISSKSYLKD